MRSLGSAIMTMTGNGWRLADVRRDSNLPRFTNLPCIGLRLKLCGDNSEGSFKVGHSGFETKRTPTMMAIGDMWFQQRLPYYICIVLYQLIILAAKHWFWCPVINNTAVNPGPRSRQKSQFGRRHPIKGLPPGGVMDGFLFWD